MLTLIVAGLLSLALPLSAHASEGEYRLLELDGYKVKWGEHRLGVGARVSYAFAGETLRFNDARNCGELAPIETLLGENLSRQTLAREAEAAFRVWERAAGLRFYEVADVRDADIILGAQGRPRGQAFANVSYAPGTEEGVRTIEKALVCLNPEHGWKVGFDGNEDIYDIRYTLIHEIGHTLGLDHPGRSGQVMGFRYSEDFDDLQPGDLRGIQQLYGPAENERGLANSIESRRPDEPTEAVIYRIGSVVAMMDGVGDFLGIGKMNVALPWNHVELPQNADEGTQD
ncbi:matrixin family metalloprotease [Wenzhouxiangella sp. EGI_FJ10305]|uniref:matrixin family metalloprotease n=1 Tax=Wenzhouxiangella sp. EGI_FJ10305 TaxID=3243768 RepID=UPI0035D85E2A